MKNYEKMYKKLVKMIKDDLKTCTPNLYNVNKRDETIDYWESEYERIILENYLEIIKEIEGKRFGNFIFNKDQYKQWKKEILL